ncbi:MAG: SDR family NAD(P)-dependent oxidoreductase [Sagittula sp.]|uniref:SDR family NAD(P)-dependent oxidoreductase n=1 Tax=Rhodobacterales TaxID=204455 RepID=UPI004058E0D9
MSDRGVAVVTGAGSGIGAACAERLAKDGWTTVCVDVRLDAAQATAKRIGGQAYELDVSVEADTEALAERIWTEVGRVTAVVACAGVLQPWHPPHELDMETFDRVVEVDFRGVYLTAKAFGTRMARAGGGAQVFISSCAAFRSTPLHAYGPAKAAVVALTETLAAEWGYSGVRINGVAPAFTLTEVIERQAKDGQRDLGTFGSDLLIQRPIRPAEIAAPVSFLLSDDASAITGVTLPVDGGLLASGVWNAYGGPRPAYDKTARHAAV